MQPIPECEDSRQARPRQGRWRRTLPGACLTFLLLTPILLARLTGAEPVEAKPPGAAPAITSVTVELEPRESFTPLITTSLSLSTRGVSFLNTPKFEDSKPVLGRFSFGEDTNLGVDTNQALPFAWDTRAGKLHLDLNRNQDLTDDPDGVHTCPQRGSYQWFSGVRLPFTGEGGTQQVLVDIMLYRYSSQPTGHLGLRTYFQGQITLANRPWQIVLIASAINPWATNHSAQLLLRPWNQGEENLNQANSYPSVRAGQSLFFQQQNYRLNWRLEPRDTNAHFQLTCQEQSTRLGTVQLTGTLIERLILTGTGDGPILLVEPPSEFQIPVGTYSRAHITLRKDQARAFREAPLQLEVTDTRPALLKAGGPLTNSVVAQRRSRYLRLNYILTGADGSGYELAHQDRSKPPGFVIYQGDRRIASGQFEFG